MTLLCTNKNAMSVPRMTEIKNAWKVTTSVAESAWTRTVHCCTNRIAISLGVGNRYGGTCAARHTPLPDDEHQDADERGRDRPQHGTRPERAQSSIPLTDEASLRIAESSRHRSAKCELVRNALARGSGSSTMNSRNTRPGCEVITMMRVEKEHRLIEQVGNEHRRQVTFPREAQQVVVEPVARELIERTERLVHQHTSGSVTRARAIETRMRMPPESWRG
jgi:hypothetical protein